MQLYQIIARVLSSDIPISLICAQNGVRGQ